jgi:hypothetical protein
MTTTTYDVRDEIATIKAYASMGTDGYHKISPIHPKRFVVTSNIKALADVAGAYWLIDAIASHQRTVQAIQKTREGNRQFWKLAVNPDDQTAVLTCTGEADTELVRQEIEYTDYPLTEEKIWVFPGETRQDGPLAVCMLPAEY